MTVAVLAAAQASAARAAELDGVVMPNARQAAGVTVRLNGMALRTFSIFGIHVYVAALYLQQPSSDGPAIMNSDQVKLLEVKFVHDASAERVRDSWIRGFKDNCVDPCHLPESEVAQFLNAVPPFKRGDSSTFLFTPAGVQISVDGRVLGTVTDPTFTRVILGTFIGHAFPNDRVKEGLLGER